MIYSRRKKEEGRRKKEEAVIAMVSAIKNVLTVLAVAIMSDRSPIIQLPGPVCEIVRFWQILLAHGPLQESG
jgi:hypothetical protein